MREVAELIRHRDRFVIASHEDPDGDSLGSSMALSLGLDQLGKTNRVVLAQEVPRNLRRLPEVDRVESVDRCPDGFAVALLVECSSFARTGLGGFDGLLSVNIDHHANNPRFADVNWIDAGVAATGVMVHRLLDELGVELTPEIATHLYVTVLTDTGSFRYSNTDAEALRLSAELVDRGPIDPSAVASAVYDNVPESRVRLIGRALESLRLEDGGAIAWMVLRSDALNAAPEDPETEGIINFAQSIEGVKVSILLKEVADGRFRVSMRSNGEVDVAELAVGFGGGGHPRAAGCPVDGSFEQVRSRVLGAVRERLPEAGPPEDPE